MALQDVILRGGKTVQLYARVTDAQAPAAIVIPALRERGLQARMLSPECSHAVLALC